MPTILRRRRVRRRWFISRRRAISIADFSERESCKAFVFFDGAFFGGILGDFADPLAFPFTATLTFGLRPRLTDCTGITTAGAFRTLEALAFPSREIVAFGLRPRFVGVAGIEIGLTGAVGDLVSFCAALAGLPCFFGTLISAWTGTFGLDFGTDEMTLGGTEDFLTRSGFVFRSVRALMIVGKGADSSSNPSNCLCGVGLLLMKSLEAWMRRVTLVSQVA